MTGFYSETYLGKHLYREGRVSKLSGGGRGEYLIFTYIKGRYLTFIILVRLHPIIV